MSQHKYLLDVLVPSWNNPIQLTQMVNSMTRIGFFQKDDRRLIIINNGKQPCSKEFAHIKNLVVVNCAENRGWEGGLIEGLKISDSEFVCFQNDDVHIPQSQIEFYDKLISSFCNKEIAAVAPITTCAAGIQSIYHQDAPIHLTEVRWLIFLCVMIKKEDLVTVGGVDETLPGGDDIDLSIRFRKAGKKLYVNPTAFLIHHGFQTGTRVKGGPEVDGGWNSPQMTERTNKALIQKHGFRSFIETVSYQVV